ncbi:MAG: hypothetical protein ACRYFR_14220 [Janthinobacterium lividum]
MKLKSVLDNLDGVDEALKAAYTEKDGKFCLNVEGLQEHPDAKALKTALDRVRDEKKALQTQFDGLNGRVGDLPDDFDLAEYNRLKDAAPGDVDKRLADQRTQIEAQNQKVVSKLTGERDATKAKLDKVIVDATLNAAIADLNLAPFAVKPVRSMFKDDIKVAYEGEEAIVTINNMPVGEHLKTWAASDEGKPFVAAPGNGGGGAGGGGGGSQDFTKKSETELFQLSCAGNQQAEAELKRRSGVK